jgi:hypothetical protein
MDPDRDLVAKVPAVTLTFWVLKIPGRLRHPLARHRLRRRQRASARPAAGVARGVVSDARHRLGLVGEHAAGGFAFSRPLASTVLLAVMAVGLVAVPQQPAGRSH